MTEKDQIFKDLKKMNDDEETTIYTYKDQYIHITIKDTHTNGSRPDILPLEFRNKETRRLCNMLSNRREDTTPSIEVLECGKTGTI